MEYWKIIKLLDNSQNQPAIFRARNWLGTNDDAHGLYSANSQIKFKTTMLKLSLYDYSCAYILLKGRITVFDKAQLS